MGSLLSTPHSDLTCEDSSSDNLQCYMRCVQGYRTEMEDAHVINYKISDELEDWSFIGVFDGHAGSLCSTLASTNIVNTLLTQTDFIKTAKNPNHTVEEIENIIIQAYLNLDANFSNNTPDVNKSGSTACCVLLSPDYIYFINLGDSRGILCDMNGNVKFATSDHKPEDNTEYHRIVAAGGNVTYARINGTLAVARAFGDFDYKANATIAATEQMVSPVPTITPIKRYVENDESGECVQYSRIILACDGVWDVFSNELISLYAHLFSQIHEDLGECLNNLIFAAMSNQSKDNISIIDIELASRKCKNAKYKLEPINESLLEEYDNWYKAIMDVCSNMVEKENEKHNSSLGSQASNIDNKSHTITKSVIQDLYDHDQGNDLGREPLSIEFKTRMSDLYTQFKSSFSKFSKPTLFPHFLYRDIRECSLEALKHKPDNQNSDSTNNQDDHSAKNNNTSNVITSETKKIPNITYKSDEENPLDHSNDVS